MVKGITEINEENEIVKGSVLPSLKIERIPTALV
jgi:hypothetical protein